MFSNIREQGRLGEGAWSQLQLTVFHTITESIEMMCIAGIIALPDLCLHDFLFSHPELDS